MMKKLFKKNLLRYSFLFAVFKLWEINDVCQKLCFHIFFIVLKN